MSISRGGVLFSPFSLSRALPFVLSSFMKFSPVNSHSLSLSLSLFLKSSVCDCDSDVRFVAVVVWHLIQAAKAFNEQHLKNDICMYKCSPHEHTHTHIQTYTTRFWCVQCKCNGACGTREQSVLVSIAVFLLVGLCVWKCVGVSFGFAFCAGFLVIYSCVCLPALPELWVAVKVKFPAGLQT